MTEGFQPGINLSQNFCLLLLNFVSSECIIEVKQKREEFNRLQGNAHIRLNHIVPPLLYIPVDQKIMCTSCLDILLICF